MDGREKPLLPLDGRPLVRHVMDSVEAADDVSLANLLLSRNARLTLRNYVDHPSARVTGGEGYHEDLRALFSESDDPLLVLPADTPLIEPDTLDLTARIHRQTGSAVSLMTTSTNRTRLGLPDPGREVQHSGINLLLPTPAPQEEYRVLLDTPGTACNVNTPGDYRAVRRLVETR